jgi:hypothetical protein
VSQISILLSSHSKSNLTSMRDKTHLKIGPNWVVMARRRSSVEAISPQASLTFLPLADKA